MSDPSSNPTGNPTGDPTGEPVIVRAVKLGKAFRRFDHPPFLLRNLLLRAVGRARPAKALWPLRDISFEIRRRETVGLVGRNGSGKSTLLRLIAGACFPTAGQISVRGRIAPLLSLGVGFQPDMTGLECVEVNATALGLSRAELTRGLDEIVSFAELTEFVNTPLRYYSSGMMARLSFSVAVHATPDLLLLDEVLAVGDHEFQKKCLARLHEMRRSGVTIILVSHSAAAVRGLCDRVIWLRDGQLVRDGEPGPILDEYAGTDAADL